MIIMYILKRKTVGAIFNNNFSHVKMF